MAVSLAVVATVAYKGRSLLKERQAEIHNQPLPQTTFINVELVKPQKGVLSETKPFLATIASDKSITLSTKLAGYIEKIYVDEAQKVRKGALLVKIDESEILSNIKALRATLSMQKADAQVAQETYERNEKLFAAGGLSKERLQQSRVMLEAKRAIVENTKQKIAQLEHQRSYLTIVAPFDGQVDKILLHEGDLAAAGRPILSMNNDSQKLLFSYAGKESSIAPGMRVLHRGKEIGHIKTIYATSKNGLNMAEVALKRNLAMPVGAQLNIDVVLNRASGCIVPSNALLHQEGQDLIMLYEDNAFTPLKVEVLLRNSQRSIITPCPEQSVAKASETKLALLPAYKNVHIIGHNHE